jgi:hypothetical protein
MNEPENVPKNAEITAFICFAWIYDIIIWPSYEILVKDKMVRIPTEWLFCVYLIVSDFSGIIFKYFFYEKNNNEGDNVQLRNIYKSLHILLISNLLGFLGRIADFLFIIIMSYKQVPLGMVWIVFLDYFSRFIFTRIFRYHNVNEIFFFFVLIVSIIFPLYHFIEEYSILIFQTRIIIYFVFTLLKIMLISLEDGLNNYLLSFRTQYILKPSSIMFVRGISNSILMIFITIIISISQNLNLKYIFRNENWKEFFFKLFMGIIIIFFSSLRTYNKLIIIKQYSSIPIAFCNSFIIIYRYYQSRTQRDFKLTERDVSTCALFLIVLFGILLASDLVTIKLFEDNESNTQQRILLEEERINSMRGNSGQQPRLIAQN